MAAYAKILKDTSGNQILPYTRAKCVYMDDNTTVQNAVTTNASTSTYGRVKIGSNISVSSGTISVDAATTSKLGVVKIGTNLSISSGIISVSNASSSTRGVVYTTSSITNGGTSVPTSGAVYDAIKDVKTSDNFNNIITPNASNIVVTHGYSKPNSISVGNVYYGLDHAIIAGQNHPMGVIAQSLPGGTISNGHRDTWVADGAFIGGNYTKDLGGTTYALFALGNGTSNAGSVSFYIKSNGNTNTSGTVTSAGADYAEYFEWLDSNTNNEDRRGLFVTLNRDKIKLASKDDDYILGIISGNPTVIGDGAENQWSNQYKRDIFGAPIYSEETENHLVLNPDYDPDKEYIPRSERPEWDPVGLMGKLICIDDGTCEVNGYCYPSENGIGTKSDHGYRVMKRIDDTHIQVLVR